VRIVESFTRYFLLTLMATHFLAATTNATAPAFGQVEEEASAGGLDESLWETSFFSQEESLVTGEDANANSNGPVYRWVHKSRVRENGENLTVLGGTNFRTIPRTDTRERPMLVSSSSEASLLGSEGNWYKIKINSLFPDARTALFTIAKVNTRSSSLALRPRLNSSINSVRVWMPKDSRVQILERHENWSLVKYEGETGFASNKYLQDLGTEEEYWHRDLSASDGVQMAELERLKEQITGTENPPSQVLSQYINLLRETLQFRKVHEIGTVILEMDRYSQMLADRQDQPSDTEFAQRAREFRDNYLFNISAEQTRSRELQQSGELDKALFWAKVGAFKSKFRNEENLQLTLSILNGQLQQSPDSNRREQIEKEISCIERTLATNQEAQAPDIDFGGSQSGEDQEAEEEEDAGGQTNPEEGSGEEADSEGPVSQDIVNQRISEADALNQRGEMERALQIATELLEQTQGRSVKVKVFLGLQYRNMAQDPRYAEAHESYRALSQLYLVEAREMTSEHHDTYPDNQEWEERLNEIGVEEDEDRKPTAEEQRVNEIIDSVVEKNKTYHYTQGKNSLEELDGETDGQSAKVKHYLALQYIILAGKKRGNEVRFLNEAKSNLQEGAELKDKHKDRFFENELWGQQASEKLIELESTIWAEITGSHRSVNDEEQSTVQEPAEPITDGNTVKITGFDMNVLTTLAILEAGARCQEETLDVAQVVMNRVNHPLFPNTIPGVSFQSGQFQPYFGILGNSRRSRRQRIFSSKGNAAQYAADHRAGLSRSMASNRMNRMEEELQNASKMRNAINFVDGRVFFLGANMSYHPNRGDVRRKRGCNHYKVGIRSADRRRHRPYMARLKAAAPLSITIR